MPKVIIHNMNTLEFSADGQKSLLQTLLDEQIDWLHSCGGKGKCTTCKMIIKEGEELLTSKSSVEKNFLANGSLAEGERLACQCRFKSSTTQEDSFSVCVAEDNKLPHIDYTDC